MGNLDVHYSSGVANHFFYLLAEGSGAKTINGVSTTARPATARRSTGIGHDAAGGDLVPRADRLHDRPAPTTPAPAPPPCSAADDLYGAGSAQSQAVAAAWSAVSVG